MKRHSQAPLGCRGELLAEGGLIKLILDRLVEPLTDTVGLVVIDVLHGQVELVFVMLTGAAELRATIGQDAQQRDLMVLKERQHPVIKATLL